MSGCYTALTSNPKASRQRMHLQHCPRDFNTSLTRLWYVLFCEADIIFQESFRVETNMTANSIKVVLILNFHSSTCLKNKKVRSLPPKGPCKYLQGAKMAWRKLVKELPATMDTSGISRITPLEIGGFVLQKKSHFAEEGYATKCKKKKTRLMDSHHLVPLGTWWWFKPCIIGYSSDITLVHTNCPSTVCM